VLNAHAKGVQCEGTNRDAGLLSWSAFRASAQQQQAGSFFVEVDHAATASGIAAAAKARLLLLHIVHPHYR